MLKQHVKHSYQWLSSTIHHQSKVSQNSPDSLRIQGPSRSSSGLFQSLLSKNAIERVEMLNLSEFTIAYFLVSKPHKGWRPVIDLSRLNTFPLVERFKWKLHRWLRIPPRFSPCITHSEMFQVKHVLTTRCLMSLFALLTSTEKMVSEGRLHMRPFSVSPQGTLQISAVIG